MGQILKSAMPAAACLAALLATALPASAQESWRPASRAGQQRAFIDTSSLRRTGDKVRFRREIRMGETRSFSDGTRYDRIGSFMEMDCRARTLQTLEAYAMLGAAVVVRQDGDGQIEPVRAGSTADADLRAACFNEWPG
ncbi:MAG TPA: surface-adhesin E family protein [Allosphingosinicella sp.]|nr:surface-adhesin E family protein [Allosphingosinicella sp.]